MGKVRAALDWVFEQLWLVRFWLCNVRVRVAKGGPMAVMISLVALCFVAMVLVTKATAGEQPPDIVNKRLSTLEAQMIDTRELLGRMNEKMDVLLERVPK